MSLRAAIYTRISSDPEGLKAGVQRQETECRDLAKRLGWDVVDVYVDNDISAYSGRPRPDYQRLLGDMRDGRLDGLLAWHPDRLHRSPTELEEFIRVVEAHGVRIRTVQSGEHDYSTPDGRMHARITGAVARRESEHKGARVKAAARQRALEGRRHGSLPWGWNKDGTVNVRQAAHIQRMADILLATRSLRAVCRDLEAHKVKTPRGGDTWSPSQVRRLLQRPTNAGWRAVRGEIVTKGDWAPILTEDTWRAVVSVLADPVRASRGRRAGRRLLTGAIYCGVCGGPMRGSANEDRRRQRWLTYACVASSSHPNRRADAIEQVVVAAIIARLETVPSIMQPATLGSSQEDAREAQALRERLDALAVDYAEDTLTRQQLQVGTERLRAKLEAVEQRLNRDSSSRVLREFREGRSPAEVWETLDLDRQKAVITLLAKVHVDSGRRGGRAFDTESIRITWQ